MGFAGNLRTLSLPEVVQTLARIQATGILRLAADEGHRDVVFNQGAIIGVEFKSGGERQALLQRMIMQNKLDATAAASISAAGSETQVVQSLIDQGLVTDDDVNEARQLQAEEELISLCTWEAADFVFHDASPDEPEAAELVEKFSSLGLTINSSSLLMEAARRIDEWSRLKERLPDGQIVLGVANGQDEGLAKASVEYPAIAVVPLVDAMRTIDDIVKDAVVTRLEVYHVLAELLEKKIVCQLSREDLIAHADYWKEQHNNQLAARLYRRALVLFPSDRETQIKLGACLEYIGDQDEAAQCYGQLARGCMDEGDPGRAAEFSRHAVSLRPQDPKLRQILARCHFMRGDQVAAGGELKEIVKIYLELGQLEDARGTCLKILEINKGDEYARRELARIFSKVENDQQSEDVVVCVQCATVNHREAQTCTSCKASLQLTCLSCGRVVAVSDRLCIFCGAHPHAGGSSGRRPGGSPTTSRIINRSGVRKAASGLAATVQAGADQASAKEKSARASGARNAVGSGSGSAGSGSAGSGSGGRGQVGTAGEAASGAQSSAERWRIDLDKHVGTARANEEAGNLEQALASWREVSKLQPDNPQILAHIKELEHEVNQLAVEQHIDFGHRMSRTRHPWQAAKSYRLALRLMSSDDPRVPPVSDALARTERDQRKISLVYGGALVVLFACGALAGRPYYQIHRFEKSAVEMHARIDALAGQRPDQAAAEMTAVDEALETLGADAERIRGTFGEQARREQSELRAQLFTARTHLAQTSLESIDKLIQARNVAEADRLLTQHQADFGTEFEPQRVQAAKDHLADLKRQMRMQDDERKSAPQKLEAAKKQEEDNHLGSAIDGYRELAKSSDGEVAAEASAAVARLEPKEQVFLTDWKAALALGGTDLARCDQALAVLTAGARTWGKEGEQLRLRQEATARLKAAEQAYAAVPATATAAQLEAFVAAHLASPQAAQAKVRLTALQSRQQGRDQAVTVFKQQMEARQYEQAWQTGRDLINGFGPLLQPGQIQLPLVIESVPTGAAVTIAGKAVGRTPMVITWKPAYAGQEADAGQIVISLAGWKPSTVSIRDAGQEWKLASNLSRQSLWQVALGKSIGAAHVMHDGAVLMLAGDTLASVDLSGRVRWRHGMGSDDVESGRTRLPYAPAEFPDGRMAFGLPNKDVAIIDAQGNAMGTMATQGEVRGRPLVYTNDVFGADTRMALGAEGLFTGAVGAIPTRIPLNAAVIAGPLALDKDLDKVLIVGTVTGHLLGILEQPKKVVWDLDLQASDISQLLPVTENLIVTVLDGSKVVAIQVRPELAAVSWSQQLKAPAVGEPAVTATGIVVAAGSSVFRFGRDGTTTAPWILPTPAASPAAALGDLVAVGTQGGTLHVFKGDQPLWATPCGQSVTAVAIAKDRIIVGLADGSVLAFTP